MSQIGRELQLTLQAALREAIVRRHAYVTVEHLLFALLHDEQGIEILRHSGAQLAALKAELDRYFEGELESVPGDEDYEALQTLAFHRVLQSAVSHCERSEKEEVEASDLVAALFQEPESHAYTLLRNQHVTRLDVLRYVSHGISKLPGDEPPIGSTLLSSTTPKKRAMPAPIRFALGFFRVIGSSPPADLAPAQRSAHSAGSAQP